MVKMRD